MPKVYLSINHEKVIADLAKFQVVKRQMLIDAFNKAALDVERKAKHLCPVSKEKGVGGRLRASIRLLFSDNQRMAYDVGTDVEYAPYVEFGTGTNVSVPTGAEDYASQFKGEGIRQVNIMPQPFLFPAAEEVRPELEKEIKEIFRKGV